MAGTRSAKASWLTDIRSGDRNSSLRISPGWIGGRRSFVRMLYSPRSMVIDDFNVLCSAVGPDKADSPLIIDSDAVLALPVAGQSFEPISGNGRDVTQCIGIMQHTQLPPSNSCDVNELPVALPVK